MLNFGTASGPMPEYTSKLISTLAKSDPSVANLAIGEPVFGPPPHLTAGLAELVNLEAVIKCSKSYEISRGSLTLRQEISRWYKRRYDLSIDPDTEILITHGGAEAIALSILVTSEPGDHIALTDPTYMLYRQSIKALGRDVQVLRRNPQSELSGALLEFEHNHPVPAAKAIIINSPENPTGYVLSQQEWNDLGRTAEENRLWVIHDEVYDSMDFSRVHVPALINPQLRERSILVNSTSKKFGLPGLRIGWMCSNKETIDKASRLHDYLNLGVNSFSETIAEYLLSGTGIDEWLNVQKDYIAKRTVRLLQTLDLQSGFSWPRTPLGGMFAFPDVKEFFTKLPESYKTHDGSIGEAVSQFLFRERKVAVVPGNVYGEEGSDCIRMVLCTDEHTFSSAITRLTSSQ